MSLPSPIVITATFSSTVDQASPAPTPLASATVGQPTDPGANIMHAYIPALIQLQAAINAELTGRLHLDANTDMRAASSSADGDRLDDDGEGDEEDVEDQEDDIDDKHTLPASALPGAASADEMQGQPGSAMANKRPRLD